MSSASSRFSGWSRCSRASGSWRCCGVGSRRCRARHAADWCPGPTFDVLDAGRSSDRHERWGTMSRCVRNWSVTRGGGRRDRPGRRGLRLAVGVLALFLFSACREELPLNTFAPAGPQARKLDSLFFLVFWLAVGVFVLVEGLIVFAAIRYRRRPGREHPVQVHGNTKLEIMWTVIPAAILVVIAVPTVLGIFDLA